MFQPVGNKPLCKEKRIHRIMNINHVWFIPKATEKPTEGRHRKSSDVKKNIG